MPRTARRSDEDRSALLSSSVRRRIVDHLDDLPVEAEEGPSREEGLTAAELGEVLDLHSTTVRFHLDQLVAAGYLGTHLVRRGGAGRPAKKYRAVEVPAGGPATDDRSYRVLAALLARAMRPGSARPSPEQAGLDWITTHPDALPPATDDDRWADRAQRVVRLMDDWGYHVEAAREGARGAQPVNDEPTEQDLPVALTLRDCPFLDLAREVPEVVCEVHLGLLRGALVVAGEADARATLRPFVTPTTCSARLLPPGLPPTPSGADR